MTVSPKKRKVTIRPLHLVKNNLHLSDKIHRIKMLERKYLHRIMKILLSEKQNLLLLIMLEMINHLLISSSHSKNNLVNNSIALRNNSLHRNRTTCKVAEALNSQEVAI